MGRVLESRWSFTLGLTVLIVALLLVTYALPTTAVHDVATGRQRANSPVVAPRRDLSSPRGQVPGTHSRSLSTPNGRHDISPMACPSLADSAWQRCDSALLAAGCSPLGRHPARAERDYETMVARLEECGLSDSSAIRIDCTDAPCMILAGSDSVAAVKRCMAGRMPITSEADGDLQPLFWNFEETADGRGELKRQWVRRQEQQRVNIATRTAASASNSVCAALEQVSVESNCDAISDAFGCTPTQDSVPLHTAQHYLEDVDALIDGLEHDCPAFVESGLTLDCSDLPCALIGVDWSRGEAGLEQWAEAMCLNEVGSIPRIVARSQGPTTLLATVWPDGWADHPQLLRRQEERSLVRDFDLLTSIPRDPTEPPSP